MKQMKCPKCSYGWETRVSKPKACPRCKTRLDVRKISRKV
jgi:predicted Zn-ribbon and HTH transcriptional regulator